MKIIFFHKCIINLSKLISFLGMVFIIGLVYILNRNNTIVVDPANPTKDISNNEFEVSILNSVFEGINKNLNPYQILSDKAFKIANNKYVLEEITASYPVGNYNLLVTALNGFFDDTKKQITLSKEVEAVIDNYTLIASTLNINMKTEEATSNSKSTIKYKNSEIIGDSLNASGSVINLNGNVSAKINLSDF